jgi:hypothetical protein
VNKVNGKFPLTALSTPIITVPAFSEQPQQFVTVTILVGQIKHSYVRETIGGNFFGIKNLQNSNIRVLRLIS